MPDLNDHEDFLRTLQELASIEDVVFQFGDRVDTVAESSTGKTRLELSGEEVKEALERPHRREPQARERLRE